MKSFVLAAALVAAVVLSALNSAVAQPPDFGADNGVPPGLSVNEANAYQGYTLIFPLQSTSTYLVDMDSRVVKEWKSDFTPAHSAYLLPNGHLLRPGAERGFGPGAGGRIQEFNWDGDLVWDFSITSLDRDNFQPHHDICQMPNGNVLVIAYEIKTAEDSEAVGRPTQGGEVQADCVLEIKPTGKNSGEVVWEWHAWDHLIQDVNESRPNYGDVTEHPELIDVNFGNDAFQRMLEDPEALAKLRSLGYVGGGNRGPSNNDDSERQDADGADASAAANDNGNSDRGGRGRGPGGGADWLHVNCVAYNADLDQIMLSVHNFSELWIIDHGTTAEEAASHAGGKRGKGGDLLYRWGNPRAYRSGTNVDQRLFAQHNAHWIAEGLPGAGHILVFNNGVDRPDGSYSSVDEIVPPLMEDGTYQREEYVAFGPERAAWSYTAKDKSKFFSHFISGAQRLPNGNTFVCSGAQATLFEVTPDNEVVWQYKHPGGGPGGPGGPGGFAMPHAGEILPEFLRSMLRFTDEQNQSLTTLQEKVDEELIGLLTAEQQEQLADAPSPGRGGPRGGFGGRGGRRGPGGPGGGFRGFAMPKPGEVLSEAVQDRLKLSDEQRESLGKLQGDVDQKLEEILTDEQQEQLAQMQDFGRNFARGGPGGRRGFGPPGGRGPGPGDVAQDDGGGRGRGRPGRGGRRGRGGPGGPGGRGGPGGLFRSYRYGADYAAFVGKDLTPGEKLADVQAANNRPER